MKKLQKIYIALIFASFFFSLTVSSASAVELYFEPNSGQFGTADQFEIKLLVDTAGDVINAIEGEIVYPGNFLRLTDIKDSNSIISFWVERPKRDKKGTILFSGIIPGGFDGILKPLSNKKYPGTLITLVFESLQNGNGEIILKNFRTFLNDGLGTTVNAVLKPFYFNTFLKEGNKKLNKMEDRTKPEEFEIIISKDENIFDGKYFLVFNTQDKGSGMYYYKVKEGSADFEIAESPYVLKNQRLYDDIIVQAVDNAGNIREENLYAINKKPFYLNNLLWLSVIILLIWIFRKKL